MSPHGLPHALFVSPRSLSEEESPFPPTSILFLLACIFLSKLLAASALWAAACHGRKQRPPQASGSDCGHNPGYQLQTLTGELGEHSGGRGLERWGREALSEYPVCCRAERHMREEDPQWREVQERSARITPACCTPAPWPPSLLALLWQKAALPLPFFLWPWKHARVCVCSRTHVCSWEVGRIPPTSGHWPLNSLTNKPNTSCFFDGLGCHEGLLFCYKARRVNTDEEKSEGLAP